MVRLEILLSPHRPFNLPVRHGQLSLTTTSWKSILAAALPGAWNKSGR